MQDHEMTLGTFDTGGEIRVSDPCHADLDTLCAQTVKVRPGTWRATAVRDQSGLVAQLAIRHTGAAAWHGWKQLSDGIGVDSGQCGFFDLATFRDNPSAARYQFRCTNKDTLAVLEAIKAEGWTYDPGWTPSRARAWCPDCDTTVKAKGLFGPWLRVKVAPPAT